MSHDLDNGAMFSVAVTPWHRLGTVLTEAPTLEEAMRLAGHNYYVEVRDTFHMGRSGEPERIPGVRVTVREDRGTVLGVVGTTYKPLQNHEVFEVLKPLLDRGVAALETGGTLSGGKRAWMMAKFNIADPVVQEVFASEVVPFALLAASHSGRESAMLMETPVRVVCANTLRSAEASGGIRFRVRHSGKGSVRLVEAADNLFGRLTDRYRNIALEFKRMKERRLTALEFERLVLDPVAPIPDANDHETQRGYGIAHDRAMAVRHAVTAAWRGGKGHTGNESAWEAYNGLVEVLDHNEALYKIAPGNRLTAMLTGALAAKKQRVARLLLAR